MVICDVSYNVAHTLPVIKFREERKAQALLKESQENVIAGFNVFDLVGKSSTAVFMLVDEKTAVGGCIARLLCYPLFWVCLHGPMFLRTEIPVAILRCLLGL
ncbi:unnamed protein product, partial [Brassica rapa]